MRYTGTKGLSYKIGATKVVLAQLRKIKAAAEVMIMCKLKCFGGSLNTGSFNRSRISFRQRQDPLQPTKGKTDPDTLRAAEIGLM